MGAFRLGPTELIIIFVFLTPGIVGALVAGNKGRSRIFWFFLCTILPLLIIVIIFLNPTKEVDGVTKQCPKCKEFIKWDATICKYCSSSL